MPYEQMRYNFGALPAQEYAHSKIAILPFPYDATASFGSGTKEGPGAIIRASRYLDEMWADPKGNLDGFKGSDIYTHDDFILSRNSAKEAVEGVYEAVWDHAVKHGKFPLILGGEHSLTSGVTRALKRKYKNFGVLQIDAHTDLMDTFEGSKYSHACVMRRIADQNLPITSVGIRNTNYQIDAYLKKNNTTIFRGADVPVSKILKSLPQDVYLTIDMDGFDPSFMPSVGTPEPGGISWQQGIGLITALFRAKNVIGCDVVELAPIPGLVAPDFAAAKLVFELIRNKMKSWV